MITVLLCLFFGIILKAQDPCPCCSEAHRQFDFWLGKWEVVTNDTNAAIAGMNEIVLAQDSCVLVENWGSARNSYTGMSYNYYNKADRRWHQLWLDNQGAVLELAGALEDGDMVMRSEANTDSLGNQSWHVIRWSPLKDGTVRQVWKQTKNGGQSFTTLFDGIYRKE